jgi:hypothetical protein
MDNYFTRPDAIKRIAEGYAASPDQIDMITEDQRYKFRKLISDMFCDLSVSGSNLRTYFQFVDNEPYDYDSIKQMRTDFVQGFIKVNTTGNNSTVWGTFYNLLFRGIHDWFHCVHELNFTFADEVTAYERQVKYSLLRAPYTWTQNDDATFKRLLRSEIIYQAAVKTHFGKFHLDTQKIILGAL